ncbi:MAG: FMN-binding protein [Spirochaetales bacterium]|jgi:electron transport complex protein RnfG|nr:FMN-binding protein [Spirochaetales bacterium]
MNKHAVAAGKIAGICFAGVLLVVLTHLVTGAAIERRDERDTYRILKDLAPDKGFGVLKPAEGSDTVLGYYPVWGKPGEAESCILVARGRGYGGPLSLFVYCKADGEILAVRLLETREYPGMGKAAEAPAYMNKFKGTGGAKPVPLTLGSLSRADAEAVSGATITFGGIARALERASSFVKNGGIRK